MSILGDKRRKLARMTYQLMGFAFANGYQLSFEFAKRCDACKVGNKNSLHKIGLAVDINLFDAGGKWLSKTEDHKPLGMFWEGMGGTWGGRWGDGNHYSLEHNGMK